MQSNLKTVLGLLAFMLVLGLVGSMDYEDEQAQQALYCDNVKSGVWPDCEDIYVSQCEPTHGPKKVEKVSF